MVNIAKLAFVQSFLSSVSSTTTTQCNSNFNVSVPGAEILSITSNEAINFSVAAMPPTQPAINGISFCNVTVVLKHVGINDTVTNTIWLPLQNWNGRFQATGGGGYSTGFVDFMAPGVAAGYSAGSTDGGNIGSGFTISPTVLTSDNEVNWPLFLDYASRSIHEMAVIGKAVTEGFYGTAPKYSYMNGCSTGGRQGYMAAQKYPEDFNGIVANSPVINLPALVVAMDWPYTVMVQEGKAPSECVFTTFVNASIALCDGLDGVKDGLISNLDACNFDPYSLVGTQVQCDGETVTIDEATAEIVQKIHDGLTSPSGEQLWYGQNWGTGFKGYYISLIEVSTTNGTTVPIANPLPQQYISMVLKKDPSFNVTTLTYSDLSDLFTYSLTEHDGLIGSNAPDLSAFRDAGGKLVSWHGLTDSLVFPNGTLDYREKVEATLGGTSAVDEFYRLFFAPGVNHCGGGYGPVPSDPFNALVAWVENGTVPETLAAEFTSDSGDIVTHDICSYPLVSRYNGVGDPNSASSYNCSTSFGPAV